MDDSSNRPRRAWRWIAVAAVLAALAAVQPWWRAAPADRRLVRDEAGLMTPAQRAAVAAYHRQLLAQHDIDYRVITGNGLADINRTAVERFRELGRHSRSHRGRGLLLLIDAGTDQVRLEVGYPLEGTFPDAFVAYVERQQMVPFFERDRVADGIIATTELIVDQAQQATDMGAAAGSASSGGAGAVVAARLGAGPGAAAADTPASVHPGDSPAATLAAYVQAMAAHDDDADLPIYTAATRTMLARWLVTPAQMDILVRTQRRCPEGTTRVGPEQRYAVIRYAPDERHCAPYFFERVGEVWLLDLATMQRVIRFNTANAWHLVPDAAHPYAFAFTDWRFDASGYPHPTRRPPAGRGGPRG